MQKILVCNDASNFGDDLSHAANILTKDGHQIQIVECKALNGVIVIQTGKTLKEQLVDLLSDPDVRKLLGLPCNCQKESTPPKGY